MNQTTSSFPKPIESEKREPNLHSLPPEIQILISKHLTYPDALSLKHSSRTFYNLVYTGVNLKIEWLIERRKLHLDCPHDRKCELGSDMTFCRGSVRLLMKRRREHGECESHEGGRGCLVFGTKVCGLRKRRLDRWMGKMPPVVLWLLVLGIGICLGVYSREVSTASLSTTELKAS